MLSQSFSVYVSKISIVTGAISDARSCSLELSLRELLAKILIGVLAFWSNGPYASVLD